MATDIASLKIKVDTKDFNKASMELDKLEGSGKKAEKSFISLNAATVASVASIYLLQKAVSSAIASGLSYNKAVEQARSGIVALSVAMQDKAIPVQERYRIAQQESIETLKELQRINVQTPHTLEQTNQIYKSMYASMKNMGASTSDMVEITRSMSIAAGAAGIEFNSLLAGVDGLATGTVLANSDLGRFLGSVGLTNDVLKNSDNVVKTITERLKDFKALGTYTEAVSNFDNAWSQLTGKMTADVFEGSKQGLNELSTLLNSMSDEDIDNLKKGMNALGIVALNVVYGISVGVIELSNTFESLGARIAGVAFRIENGIILNDEESASLERMYKNTKDSIAAREAFLDTLKKSKETMEESIGASERLAEAESKLVAKDKPATFDINARGEGGGDSETGVKDEELELGPILGPSLEEFEQFTMLEDKKKALLSSLFPIEALEEEYNKQQEILAELNEKKIGTDQERKAIELQLEANHQANINKIIEKSMSARQKFSAKSSKDQLTTVLGDMQKMTAGVAGSNKTMFEINKAAALANAAVQLPASIMKTMENYPFPLSIAMAGLQAAAGAAQIAAISSSSFGGGGGGATSMPTSGGGFVTTPGVAPSDMASPAQEEEPIAKEVTINLGDSAIISTEAVRLLMEQINEELGDGVRIRT